MKRKPTVVVATPVSLDNPADWQDGRKPWIRPELVILPVDQTAASTSPGSDGTGTPTAS